MAASGPGRDIGTLVADDRYADDLNAEEYEALTGVSKGEFETAYLDSARENMDGPALDGHVQSVALGHDRGTSTLDVIFTANHVPNRVFGWRVPIWPVPDPRAMQGGTPENLGVLSSVYLMEVINDLPDGWRLSTDEQGIEWIDDYS